ncbi:FKBP-type peptidyl-prolyl cis-trans isomerase [Mycetocola reblochoni]|uniref:Peptidyl-prolyl cis-trans isomerase n=2 Tax=Mycetocola reblochoni TaxID=331618 RepID=A0A1R4JU11_9MICO|nr:FKBP-type peptidyl-prolyl cis-trans isomerase [Mycetocola reblochoni]RLP70371.1 peptidylprolyl isomerase [Mycetocola reblochoni]SJN35506.1 FKBP-type peptidyl-prolyl cis-trans isomerases 1 [Mycetocola reblochoni REB411]
MAAAVTLTVSSCSSSPTDRALDAVTVTGDWGAAPEVTVDAPLEIEESAYRTLITGDGETVASGDSVDVHLTMLSATTGTVVSQDEYTDDSLVTFAADPEQLLPGLANALVDQTIGSRVLAVIAPDDAFGTTGSEQLGVDADEPLVGVLDLVRKTTLAADGEPQDVDPSLPSVTLDDSGAPTITIPDADPPTETEIGVLKKGDGATVAEGDTVTVQYQGVVWASGEIFDQSWGRGPMSFPTDGVIGGFSKALVGQTVGSQVIVVIPPGEDNYQEGSVPEGAAFTADDTLVFVVDILGSTA